MARRAAVLTVLPLIGAARAAAQDSPEALRAAVRELLADADTRTSLLQAAPPVGHDAAGFFIADPDAPFRLSIFGFVQFRYALSARDGDSSPGSPRAVGGFQTRRTYLNARGHVLDPALTFFLQTTFDPGSGVFRAEQAYLTYTFDGGAHAQFRLRWGQFRPPLLREELIAANNQLLAERSLANSVFTQGFSRLVEAAWLGRDARMMLATSGGLRASGGDFNASNSLLPGAETAIFGPRAPFGAAQQGGTQAWAITARAELRLAGQWSAFDTFSSPPGAEFGAALAAATHIERSRDGPGPPSAPGSTVATTLSRSAADLMLKGDGWNAFAQFVHNWTGTTGLPASFASAAEPGATRFHDFGLVVQAGAFIPGTAVEPFARYDALIPDPRRLRDAPAHTATFGLNWYVHGTAAKLTVEASRIFTPPDALLGRVAGADYLAGGIAGARETVVRVQFQVQF
ncbi:MAG: hypothetical protein IBJ11_11220 [Phycisphaerales bacterium]|nr:hypothetical protein [Phycisphaerales bacterium]